MYKNLNFSNLFTPVVVCTCAIEIPILGGGGGGGGGELNLLCF